MDVSDAARRLRCAFCFQWYLATDFIGHMRGHGYDISDDDFERWPDGSFVIIDMDPDPSEVAE